uniref:RNA recognition motif-containing protein,putative n=1 Tax=Neospora caninum (strain Liverpool) TaxID=572307 RepID=A0A0F7U717_NEOCL|nr:TPA: RNA recognition motif-containing protein,putative [Neospora caninum Liverpool]
MATLTNRGIFGSAVAAALGQENDGDGARPSTSSRNEKRDRPKVSGGDMPLRVSVFDRMEGGREAKQSAQLLTSADPVRRVIDCSRRRLVVDTSMDETGDAWATDGFGPMRRRRNGPTNARGLGSGPFRPAGGASRPGRLRAQSQEWSHDLFEEGVPRQRETKTKGVFGASGRGQDEWVHDFFEGDVTSCPGSSVFIRGLPAGVTESELRAKLAVSGTVLALKIDGGRLPTARVSFLERSAARKAVQTFHGRRMRVAGTSRMSSDVLKVAEVDKARQPESAPVAEDADDTSYLDSFAASTSARARGAVGRMRSESFLPGTAPRTSIFDRLT